MLTFNRLTVIGSSNHTDTVLSFHNGVRLVRQITLLSMLCTQRRRRLRVITGVLLIVVFVKLLYDGLPLALF